MGLTQLKTVSLPPHGKCTWLGHKNIIEEAMAVTYLFIYSFIYLFFIFILFILVVFVIH